MGKLYKRKEIKVGFSTNVPVQPSVCAYPTASFLSSWLSPDRMPRSRTPALLCCFRNGLLLQCLQLLDACTFIGAIFDGEI